MLTTTLAIPNESGVWKDSPLCSVGRPGREEERAPGPTLVEPFKPPAPSVAFMAAGREVGQLVRQPASIDSLAPAVSATAFTISASRSRRRRPSLAAGSPASSCAR